MRIKKILNYLFIAILLFAILPLLSLAQAGSNDGTLSLAINPKNPEPWQKVRVTVNSFTYDLDRSTIIWLVDGVEKKSEVGQKEIEIIAGKAGQKTTVQARVGTLNSGTKTASIVFIPSVVDLIYEAISYVPPFFKGRALNPDQGKIVVQAIPELIRSSGEKIQDKNAVYIWKKDGKAITGTSGIGKNFLSFSKATYSRDTVIEVEVSSLTNDITAYKRITVPIVSPKIIFYENSPVYGIMYNKAIKNAVKMVSDEFSVVAVPYFFSTSSANSSDLNYVWQINGQTTENQDPKNSFTTRIEKAGKGTANIKLEINNGVKIFQFANNSYTLNFEKE